MKCDSKKHKKDNVFISITFQTGYYERQFGVTDDQIIVFDSYKLFNLV